jgi:hypothetical protein
MKCNFYLSRSIAICSILAAAQLAMADVLLILHDGIPWPGTRPTPKCNPIL